MDETDSEKLDLLNRYLGPQSKRHAASLRGANSHNENQAVVKIWQRLDERYGAPESIAAALKDSLDQFKKNNNTEYDKLYELYDLLAEVESIKENDIYRTVLSFYDSSYGVNASVGKLPNFIQTKWMDRASRERQVENQPPDQISTKCTEICDDSADPTSFQGKSCAKTLLVKVYPEGKPEVSVTTYAIIDDQSNRSLACSTFIDHFNETTEPVEYMLASWSGKTVQHGRCTTGYILESLDGTTQLKCPSLIECNEIPISKLEIATSAIARHYKHLQDKEQFIPELERNAEVMLLIGRDVTAAHHILDQRIGKDNEPYAQHLRLGWAIIGKTCLGLVHTSDTITVNKTTVLQNGRETNLKPCEYGFRVKDKEPDIGSTVFQQTREDDTLGLSQEDKEFLIVMNKEFHTSENGRLSAPLPFRRDRPKLQNNYHQARQRAENLKSTCLKRSLGLCWNVVKDIFTYQLSKEEKPFTKRGLLSVINGIFDPLGFIAPVILGGRLIMREAVQNSSLDLDDPLPNNLLSDWQRWKQSLQDLETLAIGRPFTSQSLNDSTESVESMKTSISPIKTLVVSRFERFSKWSSLVRAISLLKRKIVSNNRSKVDTKDTWTCVDIRKEAEALVLRETQSQYYSNEIDCLKSEVFCIVNSRPIIAVSSDPESPTILSPNTLLTQKINSDIEPYNFDFSVKDMYKSQWKHVQVLVNQFWKQWNLQYLHNLQTRSKWPNENRNLQIGDIVLMIDISLPRNQWPTGIIDEVFPSKD
ncbi:unnamed protein product [Mytilus coruscus]|uniref:DUF5641 domain-containing protein n=1 Tax=Mytilus coruscus TaxID=42192 RepID=A0A6J8ATZ9_MYTCO|nr:unnamed protein product [Mytilus coruscus]